MVFLWFSYGFPMVFLWFSHGFPHVPHLQHLRCFGVEVNARSRVGKLTPLHVAAAQGSVDLVEHLLAAHADVLCQTEDGEMGHGIFQWDIKGYAD
jgi:ankyrin repeat protein